MLKQSPPIQLQEIRGKHGVIRTRSRGELSVTCTSRRLFARLQTVPTARLVSEAKDEIVIAFAPNQLDFVCGMIKPFHYHIAKRGN
jgi:hypothetical protein